MGKSWKSYWQDATGAQTENTENINPNVTESADILSNEYWQGVGKNLSEKYKSFTDYIGEHGLPNTTEQVFPEGMINPFETIRGMGTALDDASKPRFDFNYLTDASRLIGKGTRWLDESLPTTKYDAYIPNIETLAMFTPGIGDISPEGEGKYSVLDATFLLGEIAAANRLYRGYKGTKRVKDSEKVATDAIESMDYLDKDYHTIIAQSDEIQGLMDDWRRQGVGPTERQYRAINMARNEFNERLTKFLNASWEQVGKGENISYRTKIDGKYIELDELLVDYSKPENKTVLQKIFGVPIEDLNKIPSTFAFKLEHLAKKRMRNVYATKEEYEKFKKTYNISSIGDLQNKLFQAKLKKEGPVAAAEWAGKRLEGARLRKEKKWAEGARTVVPPETAILRSRDFTYNDYVNFLDDALLGGGTNKKWFKYGGSPHRFTEDALGSFTPTTDYIRMSPTKHVNLEQWASTASHEHRHRLDDILLGTKIDPYKKTLSDAVDYADPSYKKLYYEFKKYLKPKIKDQLPENYDDFHASPRLGEGAKEINYLAQPHETLARITQLKVDDAGLGMKGPNKNNRAYKDLLKVYTHEGIKKIYDNYWALIPAAGVPTAIPGKGKSGGGVVQRPRDEQY